MTYFGMWLVEQANNRCWFAQLAQDAKRDPAFPLEGSPETVRGYLSKRGATSDYFEMLDDAEATWAREAGGQLAA